MPASKQFAQFIALMELVETLAGRQTTESLSLRTTTGEPLGRLTVEGGQIRFGIEHRGRVFLDESFMREQPRLSVILRKILDRHSLARVERDLTWDISAIGRASLCELTARALRKVAADCVLPPASLRPPDTGLPQLRLLNVNFTPLELALAAGLWGNIRHEDPAAQIYWSPPVHTPERWLFEWQPNDPGFAWPILTDNMAMRRVADVRMFGTLAHLLCAQSLTRRLRSDRTATSATLTLFEEGVCYIASSSRYVTLLIYDRVHIARLLTSFEEFIESDTTRRPDTGGSVLLAGKVALAAGQHAASTMAGLRLAPSGGSAASEAPAAAVPGSRSDANKPVLPRPAVTPRAVPAPSPAASPPGRSTTVTAGGGPASTPLTPTPPSPATAAPAAPPSPVVIAGPAAPSSPHLETIEVRLDALGLDLDTPPPRAPGPNLRRPTPATAPMAIAPAAAPAVATESSQEWLLAAAELIDSSSWHTPGMQRQVTPSSQSLHPPIDKGPPLPPTTEPLAAALADRWASTPPPLATSALTPPAAPQPSEITGPELAAATAAPMPQEAASDSASQQTPEATSGYVVPAPHTTLTGDGEPADLPPRPGSAPWLAPTDSSQTPAPQAGSVAPWVSVVPSVGNELVSAAHQLELIRTAAMAPTLAGEATFPPESDAALESPSRAMESSAQTPEAVLPAPASSLAPPEDAPAQDLRAWSLEFEQQSPPAAPDPISPRAVEASVPVPAADPRVAAVLNLGFPELALLATLPPPDAPPQPEAIADSRLTPAREATADLAAQQHALPQQPTGQPQDPAETAAPPIPPTDAAPSEETPPAPLPLARAADPESNLLGRDDASITRWIWNGESASAAQAVEPPQTEAPAPLRSDDASAEAGELTIAYLPRENPFGAPDAPPASPDLLEAVEPSIAAAETPAAPPPIPQAEPEEIARPPIRTASETSGPSEMSGPSETGEFVAATPLLILAGFTAAIDGRTILKDLNFTLERRGVYAVMGPGGSGKSTLAGILGGHHRSSGGWEFSGRCDYEGGPLGSRRRPMTIPQILHRPVISLSSYLRCDLPQPEAATEAELHAVLTRTRLGRLLHSLDSELGRISPPLSESEWWRLAIARAILCEPALLCIDEPTAGLSEREAAPIIDVLKAEGLRRTVLFVTHNQQHARVISHYTLLIAGGRLQEMDWTETFFSGPSSRAGQDYVRTGGCYVPSPDAPAEYLSEEFQGAQPPAPDVLAGPIEVAAPARAPVEPSPPAEPSPPVEPPPPTEVATLWTETLAGSRPALSLRRYRLRVGTREILSEVSLDLADRGIYALAIPDSVSKRMLMRALCGPRPANFIIDGQAIYENRTLEEGHAPATPQTGAQLLMMNVALYIGSALAEHALSRVEQRAVTQRLIQQAGFPELLERLDTDMTSVEPDERRVLEILRAAVSNPAVLVLEDPLAGLPPLPRQRVISVLRQQAKLRTLLLLSPDDALARELSVPCGWILSGRTTLAAPPPPEPEPPPPPPPPLPEVAPAPKSPPVAEPPPDDEEQAGSLSVPPADEPTRLYGRGPRGFQWLRPGVLAGMPAPGMTNDLAYDLDLIRGAGVTHLVTLTHETLPSDELLMHGLYSIHFPITDMDVPTEDAAARLCSQLADLIAAGKSIGFHCKAGLGRTGTMLACQLIWEGTPADLALTQVRAVEPAWVQSDKQVEFLGRFDRWLQHTWPMEQGQRKKRP